MKNRDTDRNAPAFSDLELFAAATRQRTPSPMTPAFYDATFFERARHALRTLPPTAMLSDEQASKRVVAPLRPCLTARGERR